MSASAALQGCYTDLPVILAEGITDRCHQPFTYALGYAGVATAHHAWRALGCTLTSAFDSSAECRSYLRLLLPPRSVHGALNGALSADVPHCDVYFSTPPCTDYSVAGAQRGTDGATGSLMLQDIHMVRKLNPKYYVVEQSPEFLTACGGEPWRQFASQLVARGYTVHHQLMNAADYGSIQCRSRLIVVALRSDVHCSLGAFKYPARMPVHRSVADALDSDHLLDRSLLCALPVHPLPHARRHQPGHPLLVGRVGGCDRMGHHVYSTSGSAATVRSSGSLPGGNTSLYNVNGSVRRLSSAETCRLFNFSFHPDSGFGDAAKIRLLGNAVPCELLSALASSLSAHQCGSAGAARQLPPPVPVVPLADVAPFSLAAQAARAAACTAAHAAASARRVCSLLAAEHGMAARRDLAALTGNLQFVAPVLHAGSTYLRSFYDALHGLGLPLAERPGNNYHGSLPLPSGFWVDFRFYEELLQHHTGKRLMRGDWVTLVREWTDASKSGAGVSTLHNCDAGKPLTQLQFLSGVWPRHLQLNSSNWRECRTILYSLQKALQQQDSTGVRALDGAVLYVFTDNAVSASVINRGTSTSTALMRLVRGIRRFESLLGCQVVAVWTPGSEIVRQGTDGLSRAALTEGAMAPTCTDPLSFSPIDVAAPLAERCFVDAVAGLLPRTAVCHRVEDYYQQPHPGRPVVLLPPPSLARVAIDQALRWHAALPYTTAVHVIVPATYGNDWSRLASYFTRVYFARPGQFRRPAGAAGTMVLLTILPHLDPSHNRALHLPAPEQHEALPDYSRYFTHLDPTVRCTPADPHHPLAPLLAQAGTPAPPQLSLALLQRGSVDTVHARGVRRALLSPPRLAPGSPSAAFSCSVAASRLQALAFRHLVYRDARRALQLLRSHVSASDFLKWRSAAFSLLRHVNLSALGEALPSRIYFFRLPYYLWSDAAFGIVPAFEALPQQHLDGNYGSANHPSVLSEFSRLEQLGYVEGPFPFPSAHVHSVAPLGAVPKKDSDKPRLIVDMTASQLNAATSFLKFKYPSFFDVVSQAYPGCFYWKLDWTDAFFTQRIFQPFRKYFAYQHPDSGLLYHYCVLVFGWKLSPYYYSKIVNAYVDMLRLTDHYSGTLVCNSANTPQHHGTMPRLHRVRRNGAVATSMDHYCDDGMAMSPDAADGRAALRQAASLVAHLGAQPKMSKTVPPTQCDDSILGLLLDTRGSSLSIGVPPARLQALRLLMRQFRQQYRPTKHKI